MKTLVLLALVGLGAQLVDGSLGMAYGVTSTSWAPRPARAIRIRVFT